MIWRTCGSEKGTEHVWVIGQETGLLIGGILEWVFWAVGRTPSLTRRQVRYSSMTRYYDCAKAKQRLGYMPLVGLQEGIERSVKWWEEEGRKEGVKKSQ